jgi:aquaporin Z
MNFPALVKKQYVAECVGTFGLTLLVSVTLLSGVPEATAFIAALTLAIFVYTIGGISGCHINPAVTIGLWSIQKIQKNDALCYVVSQILGAVFAMVVGPILVGVQPDLSVQDLPIIGFGEMLGAAFLVFGICAVVYGNVSSGASGVTIGGSLLIGLLLASTVGNGVLNPAVAIGIGSVSVSYIIGPIIGGILSAQLYRWLAK